MIIKDCIKGFQSGVDKVIAPEETCQIVLKKLKEMKDPILKKYTFKYKSFAKIPLYKILGTDHYRFYNFPADRVSGKGHTRKLALASGLIELVERYSCNKFLKESNNWIVASFSDFKNNLFQFKDFYSNCVNKDKERCRTLKDREVVKAKIRWYKAYTLNGEKVYLPMALLISLIESSNGMAAGNCFEEALLHGICEVIERHCETLILTKKIALPSIDIDSIDSKIAMELIKRFQKENDSILIKDCSLDIGIPTLGILRKKKKNRFLFVLGTATTREEALIRALTESAQLDNNPYYGKRLASVRHLFRKKENIPFSKPSERISNINIKVELFNIKKALDKQNMKIFFLDTTDKALGIPSVIVYITKAKVYFVPGPMRTYTNIAKELQTEFSLTKNYDAYYYSLAQEFYKKREYEKTISVFSRGFLKNRISDKENKITTLMKKVFNKLRRR